MTIVEDRQEQRLEEVRTLVESGEVRKALALLPRLHPADQAALIAWLSDEQREPILRALSAEEIAQILEHLSEEPRAQLVERFDPPRLGPLLDLVPENAAADILQAMPEERAAAVLPHMTSRARVERLLVHEEDTAGGRMIPDVLALRRDWTVDEAIRFLRTQKPDVEQPYYLYVVGADRRLEGVVSLRQLIIADPETSLADVMDRDVILVDTQTDQEVAAEKMRHYDLLALPVVDERGRLVGVFSAEDVLDVQVEEATEDIYLQAGLGVQESVLSPVGTALRRRVPWLLVNLVAAFLAALTVSYFEETIAKVALLAAFMPVLAGHAGNTGTQAATLVVRGIALGEVTLRDAGKIAVRQAAFGLIHGCLAGVLTATLALLLSDSIWLAGIVFAAMIGNVIIAALVGALIPLGFRALRVDPALASAVWLTTFTDLVGFLILLSLGTLVIGRLV